MSYGFLDSFATPSVRAAQEANGVRAHWEHFGGDRKSDRFTIDEAAFISARDSFYMATASENGWPYVQHRGGPPGFLHVIDERTLAFLDYRGNRQYISLGNAAANDRVALILMDYANRARLKILAHIEFRKFEDEPELAAKLAVPGYKARAERIAILHLEAFDWNCQQHIVQRFTMDQIDEAFGPMREKLAALEAENKALKVRLGETAPA